MCTNGSIHVREAVTRRPVPLEVISWYFGHVYATRVTTLNKSVSAAKVDILTQTTGISRVHVLM